MRKAQQVSEILAIARTVYQDYQAGKLSQEALASQRPVLEAQLQEALQKLASRGYPTDAQRLANRIKRHWHEWFTFLTHPAVKPDNNDAERALRPIVVHRKVSGGARSDWGAKLVAQMFSLLETVRLQGGDTVTDWTREHCHIVSIARNLGDFKHCSRETTLLLLRNSKLF